MSEAGHGYSAPHSASDVRWGAVITSSIFLGHLQTHCPFSLSQDFLKTISVICPLQSLFLMAFYLFISLFLFQWLLRKDKNRCYVQLAMLILLISDISTWSVSGRPLVFKEFPLQMKRGLDVRSYPGGFWRTVTTQDSRLVSGGSGVVVMLCRSAVVCL